MESLVVLSQRAAQTDGYLSSGKTGRGVPVVRSILFDLMETQVTWRLNSQACWRLGFDPLVENALECFNQVNGELLCLIRHRYLVAPYLGVFK